jgi:uncharacterized protein YndB with AHSA1/START domain
VPTVIENVTVIQRSPEDVFDFLSDQGNEVLWNSDCRSSDRLTSGPVRVGSRFRAKWSQGPYVETELTELDRPKTWTYVNGGMIGCTLVVTLEPTADGGTRLISRGTWSANGVAKLVFPFFIQTMRKTEVQVMADAKRYLEERRDQAGEPD